MVHALEAYISTAASPFSDAMAEKALELIGKNIRSYVSNRKDEEAAEAMLVEELEELNESLGIPSSLSEAGVTEDKIGAMAADAMKSGNIAVNPRSSTQKDIEMLYHKAL